MFCLEESLGCEEGLALVLAVQAGPVAEGGRCELSCTTGKLISVALINSRSSSNLQLLPLLDMLLICPPFAGTLGSKRGVSGFKRGIWQPNGSIQGLWRVLFLSSSGGELVFCRRRQISRGRVAVLLASCRGD